MARSPGHGIRITTHKLTVTTDADHVQVGRKKTAALDELDEVTTREPADSVHYAVTFDDNGAKQPGSDGYEEQGGQKPYAW